jgi:hypothetical protein
MWRLGAMSHIADSRGGGDFAAATAEFLGGGFRAIRLFVLRYPSQCGLDVGKFAGSEPLDSNAGGFGLLLGKLGSRNRMHPNQTAADFCGEFLLLFFGHRSSP